MAKSKIEKQVDAAQKRVQKFIDESFAQLQTETTAAFADARKKMKKEGK